MDTTGDGFFAVFSSADNAVACALSVIEELRALRLEVRAGVHAGDCFVVGDKCTGLAINIGARLSALAAPGEVLVSQNVRRATGPGLVFTDRGIVELRGVPGLWQVYAASR